MKIYLSMYNGYPEAVHKSLKDAIKFLKKRFGDDKDNSAALDPCAVMVFSSFDRANMKTAWIN